jgi:hypothetical protein
MPLWRGKGNYKFNVESDESPPSCTFAIKFALLRVALSFSMSVLPRITTREPLFMKCGIGALTAICLLVLVLVKMGSNCVHCVSTYGLCFFFAMGKAFAS